MSGFGHLIRHRLADRLFWGKDELAMKEND